MSEAGEARAYALEPSPCGGLRLAFRCANVVCRVAGSLWIESARALVVADLHLEKGSAFAIRGQLLPPYDTRDTLARLEAEVAVLAPRLIVLLGDSFHDGGGEARLAADDRARLAGLARGRTLLWIVGNHDRAGPAELAGDVAGETCCGGLRLVHEPSAPDPSESADGVETSLGEAAGHLHPCARVRAKVGSVRRRCFVTDGARLVLPAFGALAGGLNVRDAAFARILNRRPLAAVLGADRVHPVGWDSLRRD